MIKRRFVILTTTALLGVTGLAACGSSSSPSSATTAASSSGGGPASLEPAAHPTGSARRPPAGAPGMGTPVTGAAATKASKAATAKYPGKVERVVKLLDGSYEVHVITSSGEKHVKVSQAFGVTGVDTRGPGRGPHCGPGMGTPATGAAATKASKAATAKYPGKVERVMKLPDGSYEVHVITSSGEKHVEVSKDFKVTGVQTGGPPHGHPGPPPRSSSAPSASSGTSSS